METITITFEATPNPDGSATLTIPIGSEIQVKKDNLPTFTRAGKLTIQNSIITVGEGGLVEDVSTGGQAKALLSKQDIENMDAKKKMDDLAKGLRNDYNRPRGIK